MNSNVTYNNFIPDSVVDHIINKFVTRAEMGFKKYNNTLDRTDLTASEWLEHAIEEHMDAILYLTKVKNNLENGKENTSDN